MENKNEIKSKKLKFRDVCISPGEASPSVASVSMRTIRRKGKVYLRILLKVRQKKNEVSKFTEEYIASEIFKNLENINFVSFLPLTPNKAIIKSLPTEKIELTSMLISIIIEKKAVVLTVSDTVSTTDVSTIDIRTAPFMSNRTTNNSIEIEIAPSAEIDGIFKLKEQKRSSYGPKLYNALGNEERDLEKILARHILSRSPIYIVDILKALEDIKTIYKENGDIRSRIISLKEKMDKCNDSNMVAQALGTFNLNNALDSKLEKPIIFGSTRKEVTIYDIEYLCKMIKSVEIIIDDKRREVDSCSYNFGLSNSGEISHMISDIGATDLSFTKLLRFKVGEIFFDNK